MLDVVVKCEDGTVADGFQDIGPFVDEGAMVSAATVSVAAPGMVTMIDPSMGDLG